MKPVRVLHVVTYMGRGGLETMLMNYYRAIDRTKLQFDFLVHRAFQADYDEEILGLGGKIFRLPNLNPFSRSYLCQLDRFFEQHPEYQIVHSHLDCMSAIPLKYAKKHGVPMRIAHAHNKSQDKDLKYPIKLFSRKMIPRYADDLFACGVESGKWMFCGKKFSVFNNAIDVSQYLYDAKIGEIVRKELNIEHSFVVGHVGRFNPQKNHKFLIDIFMILLELEPTSKLLLIGDGDGIQEIQSKVKSLGIEHNVVFTGVRSDVNRLMQAMDVFVFPSLYEGLPVTLVEAQAAGLPCVISNRIPIECRMTDLVSVLPLADSPRVWAKQVLKKRGVLRTSQQEKLSARGYDIKQASKWLESFYMEKLV